VIDSNSLQGALGHFLNRRCTGFASRKIAGTTIILLYFEPPRKGAKKGGATKTDYSVVVYCSWRLDSSQEVICGSQSARSSEGSVKSGLKGVVGQRITSLSLDQPGLDANLLFENGLTLRIFCDNVNEEDDVDNYLLYLKDQVLLVGTKSRLRSESRRISETEG
jgi:hypothetical protein